MSNSYDFPNREVSSPTKKEPEVDERQQTSSFMSNHSKEPTKEQTNTNNTNNISSKDKEEAKKAVQKIPVICTLHRQVLLVITDTHAAMNITSTQKMQ
jgi:hypothetical protein